MNIEMGIVVENIETVPKLSDFYRSLNSEFAGKPYYEGVEIDIANRISDFIQRLIDSKTCHPVFAEDLEDILTENIIAVVMQMLRGRGIIQ
jgi:hypothetical protein